MQNSPCIITDTICKTKLGIFVERVEHYHNSNIDTETTLYYAAYNALIYICVLIEMVLELQYQNSMSSEMQIKNCLFLTQNQPSIASSINFM